MMSTRALKLGKENAYVLDSVSRECLRPRSGVTTRFTPVFRRPNNVYARDPASQQRLRP